MAKVTVRNWRWWVALPIAVPIGAVALAEFFLYLLMRGTELAHDQFEFHIVARAQHNLRKVMGWVHGKA